jgi:hypothetical protein
MVAVWPAPTGVEQVRRRKSPRAAQCRARVASGQPDRRMGSTRAT